MKGNPAVSPHALPWMPCVQGTQGSMKHKKGWCAMNGKLRGHRKNLSAAPKTNVVASLSVDMKTQLHLRLRLLSWEALLRPEQKRSSVCTPSSEAAEPWPH